MENFKFHAYTEILFGKGQIEQLPRVLAPLGKNILLVYGGGSIQKNGIYQKAMALLSDFTTFELGGVEPNPRIESVRAGVALCKAHHIDAVLAIGGGSAIDCAKVIAAGFFYDGDAWDLVTDPEKIQKALPIVTILTIAATGSEMNKNAVISNMQTNEKLGTAAQCFIPTASILDPTYTYTLPAIQTAAGTADIMSHVFESYFKVTDDAFVQDRFSEGILKTCIHYCKIALAEPENYSARANLMWASTTALNGLCGSGKGGAWSCHPIEHELSAFYDIVHGIGLAIVTPHWMRHILNENTVDKFAEYAINVWGIAESDDKFALAHAGIDKTAQFFESCGLPMTLTSLGIDQTHFDDMAKGAVARGGLAYAYVPLTEQDVREILTNCL